MNAASGPGARPADPDFAAWFAREYPRVRATLALAVGDHALAEEAAAEAFARALVRWPVLRRDGSPNAWVYTVAMNQVRSWARRRRLERRYLARLREDHEPPPDEPEPDLWRVVATLPDRTRTAVALRYIADLTETQVAEAMGVTRGAVAATLHAARRRLADELAGHQVAPADPGRGRTRRSGPAAAPAPPCPAAAPAPATFQPVPALHREGEAR